MVPMSEFDSAAGLERWPINTDRMLLIVPAVCAAASLTGPRLAAKTHTREMFAHRAEASGAVARARTHVEVGARCRTSL
jgi:hypothetical protein